MIIGFTGTRVGLHEAQRSRLASELYLRSGDTTLHHGDCIGADAESHDLAYHLGFQIVIHPPEHERYRAHADQVWPTPSTVVLEPKPYLDRNHDIVDACDVLIACPAESLHPRSTRGKGTWATIDYAGRVRRPLLIIYPNGRTENRA